MKHRTWLISWIGAADLECAEDKRSSDLGPIATALCGVKRYDRVYLLTNYDFDRSKGYCTWLESVSKYDSSAIRLVHPEKRSTAKKHFAAKLLLCVPLLIYPTR